MTIEPERGRQGEPVWRSNWSAAKPTAAVDLRAGSLWLANAARRAYWEGTVEEYCGEARALLDASITAVESRLAASSALSPELASRLEDARRELLALRRRLDAPLGRAGDGHATVEVTDQVEMLDGFETRRYRVLLNGSFVQELWVTTDPRVAEELGLQALVAAWDRFACLTGLAPAFGISDTASSPELARLLARGFPLKTVTVTAQGSKQQRVRLERAELADTSFRPPSGFERAALQQVLGIP